MTDRPILFSAPMIQALFAGRKTQTRRTIKLPKWSTEEHDHVELDDDGTPMIICKDTGCFASIPIRFAKGDRLWVREAHRVTSWDEDGAVWISYDADGARSKALEPPDDDFVERLCAKLDKAGVPTQNNGFYADDIPENLLRRVSIHMPRWASRLTLTVTDVRVERLQEISEDDAIAEGSREPSLVPIIGACWSERDAYAKLWEHINGPGSWATNPWVVAVSFSVEHRNIDA